MSGPNGKPFSSCKVWVALKRAGCGRQQGLTEIAGLDIDGLDNDGRIWAIDCNLLKITIQSFYQFTGTQNSFENVLCLKTYEIHIDQQKLRTYNEC